MQSKNHTNSDIENRREPRYQCIGIPLLYSALNDKVVTDLGENIYNAAVIDMSLSGLAFDIEEPMQEGDKIHMLFDKSDIDADDVLMTKVRWCKTLPSGLYRIGVEVDKSISWNAKFDAKTKFYGQRKAPSEIEVRCPACNNESVFNFSGFQPVMGCKAQLLLYDCSLCGTTRSLTGIIDINKK